MPRRNLRWLLVITALSSVCYAYVPHSRYSRMLASNFDLIARDYYRPVDEPKLFESAMTGIRRHAGSEVGLDRELKLFEGAMSGMVSLLDKNSKYVSAVEKTNYVESDLNQEIVGIGVIVAPDPASKQLLVLSPVPDSPAYAAGIRAGDHIVKIEGQKTEGMAQKDASARIKGKAETSVTITVQHPGSAQTADLTIVRRTVHEDTIKGATCRPDGRWDFVLPGRPQIGYVAIKVFAEPDDSEKSTTGDFRAAMDQLFKKDESLVNDNAQSGKENIRGLVLDLRDNPGGTLHAAVEICNMLVPEGEIVTTRGRDHQVLRAYRASGRAAFTGFPIVVLVNGSSASASEIVAACLQDNERAVVAGQRSYGKGTVQQVFDLGRPFGILKFTIATYWRPSGQDINRPTEDGKDIPWGVTPNSGLEVPVTDDERERLLINQQDREIAALTGAKPPPEVPDRVLLKAIEYLDEKGK